MARKLLTTLNLLVAFPFLWVHDLTRAVRHGLRHSGRLTLRSLPRLLRNVWVQP